MYRLLVIARYTFLEAVLQPIYSLLVALCAGILCIFSLLPFFTLGEDTRMYKIVSADVILLFVLLATLFATSKSIYEEIEDRTMLTLMSKPVQRWQVMIGKYLGIIMAAALAVLILGIVMALGTWYRIPNDYFLSRTSLNDLTRRDIYNYRWEHLAGIAPQLILTWLQISVLASVGVALSTRFSLVVNLPSVIFIYLAGNLTRFIFPLKTGAVAGGSVAIKGFAWLISLIIPYLGTFDLKSLALLSTIKIKGTGTEFDPGAISVWLLWQYVGLATLNAIAYATFALGAGMLSFQRRELGGGEG